MSLHNLSAHIATKGRGQDTALVHMTQPELAGLQALARKAGHEGLPVNPETGLPEAGILSSLLPVLAGVALGPAGLGMSALGAGATVGGISALASGSLMKGISAGFGAWGGAGLTNALMGGGVGEVAAGEAAKQAAGSAASGGAAAAAQAPVAPVAAEAAQQGLGAIPNEFMGGMNEQSLMQAAQAAPPAPPANANPMSIADTAQSATDPYEQAYMEGKMAGAPAPAGAAQPGRIPFSMDNNHWETMKSNWDKVSLDPLTKNPMDFLKKNAPYALAAASPLLTPQPGQGRPGDKTPAMIRPYTFTRERTGARGTGGQGESRYFNDRYTAGTPYRADEQRFAEGGRPDMSYDPTSQLYSVNTGVAPVAPNAGIDYGTLPQFTYNPLTQQYEKVETAPDVGLPAPGVGGMEYAGDGGASPGAGADAGPGDTDASSGPSADAGGGPSGADGGPGTGAGWAKGGLAALAGRHLKGPGDGMSDSIPATIEGKQPARLAADEFVVPADVVSHLGNGSSDAGAKQLYAMMDRVRAARTGRTKQAPAINTRKALPA